MRRLYFCQHSRFFDLSITIILKLLIAPILILFELLFYHLFMGNLVFLFPIYQEYNFYFGYPLIYFYICS